MDRLLLLGELEDNGLSSQLVVDRGEGLELVVQVAGILLVEEPNIESACCRLTISTTLFDPLPPDGG